MSLLVWLFFSKWISHFGTELLVSSLVSCQIRSPDKWHPHLSLLLLCYRFTSVRISTVWGYIDSSCWFALFIVDLLVCAEKLVYLFFSVSYSLQPEMDDVIYSWLKFSEDPITLLINKYIIIHNNETCSNSQYSAEKKQEG